MRSCPLPVLATVMAVCLVPIVHGAVPQDNRQPDPPTKPNILFIFADDLSYDSVHETGNPEVQTPNLDRLARAGTTFTHAYNMGAWGGAVCVASRRMLNTGQFVWHAKDLNLTDELAAGRMWSQRMKSAGYETYFTGKWHVPVKPAAIFDHVGHVRAGMPNQTPEGYNRPIVGQPDPWKPWDRSKNGYWKGGKHWSEVVGDEAIGFLNEASQSENPFFMYIAFNAPHDPRQSPQEFVEKYPLDAIAVPTNFLPEYPYKDAIGCGKKLRDEKLAPFPRTEYAVKVNRQEYYAIITHMDQQIGRILTALEQSEMSDNTIVFFTADHGLAVGHHGLIGKQNMYEHSMRVPFFMKGPNIPANQQLDTRIYLQDVVPTTLELAGLEKPAPIQFKSLLPLIQGKRKQHYDSIYGAYMLLQRMVIKDNMKLILYPKASKERLYDLGKDPLEMNDLSESPEHAATLKQLRNALTRLQLETGDPLDLKSAFAD